jgi:hypothetical protein
MARLKIALNSIKCNNETSDGGAADEPYFITCTLFRTFVPEDCKDLQHLVKHQLELRLFNIPGGNVDAGETFGTSRIDTFDFLATETNVPLPNHDLHREYNHGGTARTRFTQDELIVVGMLLEHDDSSRSKVFRSTVKKVEELLFKDGKPNGFMALPHLELEAQLVKTMKGAFNKAKETAWTQNDDDLVSITRVAISTAQTTAAINGAPQVLTQVLSGDGGKYTMEYRMTGGKI